MPKISEFFSQIVEPEYIPVIADQIIKTINNMTDTESASYNYGTNIITVTANWKDYEVPLKIKSIKEIPNVLDIKKVHTESTFLEFI